MQQHAALKRSCARTGAKVALGRPLPLKAASRSQAGAHALSPRCRPTTFPHRQCARVLAGRGQNKGMLSAAPAEACLCGGSRTLISVRKTALAERPGQPYPATFRKWTHRESNPDLQSAELVSSRWTMSPFQSGEWGSNPRSPASKAGGLPLSYPLKWTARDLHPHFRRAGPAPSSWTSSPFSDPGWTRTIVAWMWARSLCFWTTGPSQ